MNQCFVECKGWCIVGTPDAIVRLRGEPSKGRARAFKGDDVSPEFHGETVEDAVNQALEWIRGDKLERIGSIQPGFLQEDRPA